MSRTWRELQRTLAVCSPLLLGGCGAYLLVPAWCLSECQEDPPMQASLELTIISPAELAEFDAEAVTIAFEVDQNIGGVMVAANAGGNDAAIALPDGVLAGELTITPEEDSGLIRIGVTAWSVGDPTIIVSRSRMIQWAAPWTATILDCGPTSCAPLAADATLSGIENLAIRPTWDVARLASVELTIDGVAPQDQDLVSNNVAFDVDALADGPVTLAFTAVRDDGARATVTRTIDVANCGRARPNAQYQIAAYTTDGRLITGGDDGLVARDLHDGTTGVPYALGGTITALTLDEAGQLAYFGLATAAPSYRIGAVPYDAAGTETTLDATAQARSIVVGPDGAVYWSEGTRFGAPVGAVWRKVPGSVATSARVDIGGLPGADGLVFDDDGTLLVAAGDSIIRLTLTAGVETARATVVTRAGATFSLIALDEQGRLYVTDRTAGQLVRYTGSIEAVLYTQPDWSANEPWSMTFVEYPPRCHGLLITRPGLDDARRMVDVGEVRGRP